MGELGQLLAVDLYPFKGARDATIGCAEINAAEVTDTGLQVQGIGDREVFAIAETRDGGRIVITPRGRSTPDGREHEFTGDRALKRIAVDITGERQMTLSVRGIGEVALDLNDRPLGSTVRAGLHRGAVWGYDLGGRAAEFIQEVTGRGDAALMRVDRSKPRVVGPGQTRSSLAADSQPISLGNLESLAALHDLRRESAVADAPEKPDVPMSRYRPNLTVNSFGDGPFAEDRARLLQIGDRRLRVAAGIVRCVVTNLDNEGDMVGGGLHLLVPRRGHRINVQGDAEGGRPEPIFCVSLNPEEGQSEGGLVTVGETVKVLDWGASNVKIG